MTSDKPQAVASNALLAFRISRPAKQVGGALAVRLKNRRVICRMLSDGSFQYRFKRYMPGYGINTQEVVLSEEAVAAMATLMLRLKKANPTGLLCAGLGAHKQDPVVGGLNSEGTE